MLAIFFPLFSPFSSFCYEQAFWFIFSSYFSLLFFAHLVSFCTRAVLESAVSLQILVYPNNFLTSVPQIHMIAWFFSLTSSTLTTHSRSLLLPTSLMTWLCFASSPATAPLNWTNDTQMIAIKYLTLCRHMMYKIRYFTISRCDSAMYTCNVLFCLFRSLFLSWFFFFSLISLLVFLPFMRYPFEKLHVHCMRREQTEWMNVLADVPMWL